MANRSHKPLLINETFIGLLHALHSSSLPALVLLQLLLKEQLRSLVDELVEEQQDGSPPEQLVYMQQELHIAVLIEGVFRLDASQHLDVVGLLVVEGEVGVGQVMAVREEALLVDGIELQ